VDKHLKYGDIELMVQYPFSKPTKETFDNWKKDFLKLKEAKSFKIYLVGTFSEKLLGKDVDCRDVDIVLIGKPHVKKLEKLIYEGTRLGFEKYNTFFDIMWFSEMPNYDELWDEKKALVIDVCLLSPELLIDGVNINSKLKLKNQISKNLWVTPAYFPTTKQSQKMYDGFKYSQPMLIND